MAELRQTFRPEFLNRIDDIIVFRALTEQDIEEVARRMLKTVAGRMEAMDIHPVSYTHLTLPTKLEV